MKDYGRSWIKLTFGTFISLTGVMMIGDGFAMDRNSPYLNRLGHPTQLEQVSESNMQDSTALLLTKLDDLQRQLQQLRGEMEIQSHELSRLQQQQANFVNFQKEYEESLQAEQDSLSITTQNQIVSEGQAQSSLQTTNTDSTIPDFQSEPLNLEVSKTMLVPADEKSSYDAAYELIQQRQFKSAIAAMRQYLVTFPHGLYTANAIYWLGELYLADGTPQQALDQFNIIINQYPDSNKVGPSMLKIGFAYQMLGDLNKANQQLRKVQQEFPGSPVSQLASVRLQEITQKPSAS